MGQDLIEIMLTVCTVWIKVGSGYTVIWVTVNTCSTHGLGQVWVWVNTCKPSLGQGNTCSIQRFGSRFGFGQLELEDILVAKLVLVKA